MTYTVNITTDIPANRRVELVLPPGVPAGEADLVVVVVPRAPSHGRMGKDLLTSEVFGMWADRTDLPDSEEYALQLRDRAWRRG